MRFNVYAAKAVRDNAMYNTFEELLAASGAAFVGRQKRGLEGESVDIQVNTIPFERAAGQFVFTIGGAFEPAPLGRSHLTMEVDYIEDLPTGPIGVSLMSYAACALASAMFPAELTRNVNCWAKQHGHADRTGWHEGRVEALPANHVANVLAEFAAGRATFSSAIITMRRAFVGNVK